MEIFAQEFEPAKAHSLSKQFCTMICFSNNDSWCELCLHGKVWWEWYVFQIMKIVQNCLLSEWILVSLVLSSLALRSLSWGPARAQSAFPLNIAHSRVGRALGIRAANPSKCSSINQHSGNQPYTKWLQGTRDFKIGLEVYLEHNKIDRNELQIRTNSQKGTGTKMAEKLNNFEKFEKKSQILALILTQRHLDD